MSDTRPELSKKNRYWIEKERYLELRHFCMQYKTWKQRCKEINAIASTKISDGKNAKNISNPVAIAVEKREEYIRKIELIENAANDADSELSYYLIKGVTEGVSYYGLRLIYEMPTCKEKYYTAYRRFFFILDATRDLRFIL